MKRKLILQACVIASFLAGCGAGQTETEDYTRYVNPFIGTGGHGHTYPGAIVPNGMIHPSPDTRIYGWDASAGYYYADSTINGFSHTHLSGTGCSDYGDVLLMPTIGEQNVEVESGEHQVQPYASAFSHEKETASPGYYSVFLDRYGVKAELTATRRAALHRYTFPKSDDAGFILDLDYSIQFLNQKNRALSLEVVNDSTLRGYKYTSGWAWKQDVYFYAVFSKPFDCTLVTDSVPQKNGSFAPGRCKALLKFKTDQNEQVLVKVALSAVDGDGAEKNLAEIPGWDFEGTKASARQAWNDYLSKIEIETGDEERKRIFYTALYHTAVSPCLFTDIDGRYRGMDRKIHVAPEGKPMYTVFSLWDTFRALHPLLTIIDPEQNSLYIRTLLQQYQDGGILPMWELAGNYTGTMIGYHAVPVIVDAYMKGDRAFDAEKALQACLRSAEYDTLSPVATTRYLLHNALMPMSKHYKNTLGYIPCDKELESVAKGLEYAYNDWCISVLAEALGDTATQRIYTERGKAYRNYFDASVGFMRGKDSRGEWRTPFSPSASNHRNDDYCEGTAWQWTWFVPHDIEGLANLMGGREAFLNKLDSLFKADSSLEGEQVSADISGLIGQYAHGNEPSHHVLYMYNTMGQPWKAQELLDEVMRTQYFNAPDGLSGNEDCGQMSAWYVLNSLGFYQPCPGKPVYSIGRPLFDAATLHLPGGKDFHIKVANNSPENKYVQSVKLNGHPLETPFFNHDALTDGGTLEFVMSDKPTRWGAY